MDPPTTTEFWTSDNDEDEVDMLIQRILFRFHEIIYYSNFFLCLVLVLCIMIFVFGIGFIVYVQFKITKNLDVTAMEKQAIKEKELKKKLKEELKYY